MCSARTPPRKHTIPFFYQGLLKYLTLPTTSCHAIQLLLHCSAPMVLHRQGKASTRISSRIPLKPLKNNFHRSSRAIRKVVWLCKGEREVYKKSKVARPLVPATVLSQLQWV